MFEEPIFQQFYYHITQDMVIFVFSRVNMTFPRPGWYIRYNAVVVNPKFCALPGAKAKLERGAPFMINEKRFKANFRPVPVLSGRNVTLMGLDGPHSVGTFVHVLSTDCIYKQWPTKGGWIEYFDNSGEFANTYMASLAKGSARGVTVIGGSRLKKKSAMEKDAWESRVQAMVGDLDL